MTGRTIALLDTDPSALHQAAAWVADNSPELDVTIRATSWGELLTNNQFPPQAVVLHPKATDRVNPAYETRVCRILDIEVIVIIDHTLEHAHESFRSAGAHIAHGLEHAATVLKTI